MKFRKISWKRFFAYSSLLLFFFVYVAISMPFVLKYVLEPLEPQSLEVFCAVGTMAMLGLVALSIEIPLLPKKQTGDRKA